MKLHAWKLYQSMRRRPELKFSYSCTYSYIGIVVRYMCAEEGRQIGIDEWRAAAFVCIIRCARIDKISVNNSILAVLVACLSSFYQLITRLSAIAAAAE